MQCNQTKGLEHSQRTELSLFFASNSQLEVTFFNWYTTHIWTQSTFFQNKSEAIIGWGQNLAKIKFQCVVDQIKRCRDQKS